MRSNHMEGFIGQRKRGNRPAAPVKAKTVSTKTSRRPNPKPTRLRKTIRLQKTSKPKQAKKLGFRGLSFSESLVFASGAMFATGILVLGFYTGLTKPDVAAESDPITVAVEVPVNSNNITSSILSNQTETVEVSVDPGIDINDVDWTPPPPPSPDTPDRLIIPQLGLDADVRSLGLTRSGALAVPNYTSQVGWFNQSARPGSPGTIVMDGHYGIPAGRAAFGNLKELTAGSQVQIKRIDGTLLTYAVERIENYELGNVPMAEVIASDGSERLNLITCNGGWSNDAGTYDSRLIVYTKRV